MATLDEPYLFSSYQCEPSTSKDGYRLATSSLRYGGETEENSDNALVLASNASKRGSSSRRRRNVAVASVQRSAVHLLDLADQSPLSSFTVPPSVSFTSSAVAISLDPSEEASSPRKRRTFVGVRDENAAKGQEHALWQWMEEESADGSAQGEPVLTKETFEVEIVSIDVSVVAGHILVAFANGSTSLLDYTLQTVSRLPSSASQSSRTTKVSVHTSPFPFLKLSASSASDYRTFATVSIASPASADPSASVSTKKSKKGKRQSLPVADAANAPSTAKLSFLAVAVGNEEKTMKQVASWDVPSNGDSEIADVALLGGPNGVVSILYASGDLTTYRLSVDSPTDLSTLMTENSVSLGLNALAQKTLSFSPSLLSFASARLLPLTSSTNTLTSTPFLLLAASSTSKPFEVQLLVLDTLYSIILSATKLDVLSLAGTGQSGQYALARLDERNVSIAVGPAASSSDGGSAKRSSFYVAGILVPEQGRLADMVGKVALTQSFLVKTDADRSEAKDVGGLEKSDYVQQREKRAATLVKQLASMLSGPIRDVAKAETLFTSWWNNERSLLPKGGLPALLLSTSQVTHIIELALPPVSDSNTRSTRPAVAAKIIELLISQGFASNSSAKDGLTETLLVYGQWDNVLLAIKRLADISESTLVEVLKTRLDMPQFAPGVPSVEAVMEAVVRYRVGAPALRLALRQQLSVEDLEPVLVLLDSWLSSSDSTLFSHSITFLQAVFDAHLIALLQSQALHPVILSLSSHLSTELFLSSALQGLRGPLETISKVRKEQKNQASVQVFTNVNTAKAQRALGASGKNGKKGKQSQSDQRFRKKQSMIQESLVVGEYSVDEFKL